MSLKNTLYSCGVIYEIVSNIPKVKLFMKVFHLSNESCFPSMLLRTRLVFVFPLQASEEPEERETLALMAARGDCEETQDGETYIEKYTRGVLEVENILSLERLRQVLYIGILGMIWSNSCTGWAVKMHLVLFLQAVTVKEALAAKGRHLRRSISTPNVQHVMNTSPTAPLTEPHGNNRY